MSITRVGRKHQVTIPKVIPKDQAWFWTPEWQQKEREADEEIAQGRLSGPFTTAEALIKHLRRLRKCRS